MKRGWLGDKAGQGFYKKMRGADGKEERLVLDLATFEYRPAAKPALPVAGDGEECGARCGERLKMLLANDPAKDKAAGFLWPFLAALWSYAADRIGEVATMRPRSTGRCGRDSTGSWGRLRCGMRRALAATVERMKALGLPVSRSAEALLAAGQTSWYASDGRECFQPATGRHGAGCGG